MEQMFNILQGLLEFKDKYQDKFISQFPDLATGQNPQALLVICCDSRIMPNISTRIGPGDMFVLRNIGNIIPPYNYIDRGNTIKHSSVLAALEFGLKYLEIPNIIICGHSECGAMKYLLANQEVPDTPYLHNWISEAKNVYTSFASKYNSSLIPKEEAHNELSRQNVIHQLENLKTIPIVKDKIAQNKLKIHGWWLDISTYNLSYYIEAQNKFIEINKDNLETIKAQLEVE